MAEGFGAAARDFARLAWRECRRKIRYDDAETATRMAHRIWRRTGDQMHAYRCRLCAFWHLGH